MFKPLSDLIDRITPENQHIPERSPEPAPTKITLENCGPENLKFNAEWHLVSANRIAWTGKPYARPGEALITANVGAWYDTACYWREESEKLQSKLSGESRQ